MASVETQLKQAGTVMGIITGVVITLIIVISVGFVMIDKRLDVLESK